MEPAQKHEKEGKGASKPNINVQAIWKKFMRYFDTKQRISLLKLGNYCPTTKQLDEQVDENTTCVVAIADQTFTDEDDDIWSIHDWLDNYEK